MGQKVSCCRGTGLFPASLTLHEFAPRALETASAKVHESKLMGRCGTASKSAKDKLETNSYVQI